MAKRLLLIGWEAADWNIIHPLLDRGELPALSSLVDRGVLGKLASLHPVAPIINWTSIATGKAADKHGIVGAFEPDSRTGRLRPVTGKSRRAKALWQITSERGLATHVVGWFGAEPAECVSGIFVSPSFAAPRKHSFDAWPMSNGCVLPEDIAATLADLRMHPSEVPSGALLPFVPRAGEVDQRYDDRLAKIAFGLAACCSIHNAATWTLENRPWDFMAVYYNAIGYFSDHFMVYHPPRMRTVAEGEFELYRDVVNSIYRFQDQMLARLIQIAGDEASIVLVSANGFESGNRRPERTNAGFRLPELWARDQGILCVCGTGVRRDELVRGASVLDVAPTILALLGLPLGEDMDGKVLLDVFDDMPPIQRIATWEATPQAGSIPASAASAGLADQFLTLDAFDIARKSPRPDERTAAEHLRFNLACVYMSTGRPSMALPIFEQLYESAPEELRYARSLAQCYLAVGRPDDADHLLSNLLAGHEIHAWMHLFSGIIRMHRDERGAALAAFAKAAELGENSAAIHSSIANVHLSRRSWSAAEECFAKALEIDPDHPAAHTGMAAVRLRQKREEEAADHALTAIELRYEQPAAHYQLGVAMARMGRYDRAAMALEQALKLAPNAARVRRYLSMVQARINPAAPWMRS